MDRTIERLVSLDRGGRLSRRGFLSLSAMLAGQAAWGQPLAAASPFPVRTLLHSALEGVASAQKTVEFYQRLFDLHVYTRGQKGAMPIVTVASGPQCFAVLEGGAPATRRIGHHVCVGIDDFHPDRVMKHLAELGVKGSLSPRLASDQRPPGPPGVEVVEVFVMDPDGVRLQIQDVRYCGGVGALGEECGIPPSPPTSAAPFAVRRLLGISVGVSNVERSLAFYQRVFDCPVVTRQAKGAVPILRVGRGPDFIALHQGSNFGNHMIFGIDDFEPDRVMKTLADHGVKATMTIRRSADQRPQGPHGADTPEITFTDPDGFVIQIQDESYCGGVGPLGNVCS